MSARRTAAMRVGWNALGLLLLAALPAGAQPYAIDWWTADAGGVTDAAGGPYGLGATAGQPDAGGPFSGGPYALRSGFWSLVGGGGPGPQADLAITKTDGQATAVPGQAITYTIVVTNLGPDPASGATVSDPLPAGLTSASWTCTATAGSSCPPSGTGGIGAAVSLPAGGSATFTLAATVQPAATGTLTNTASVTPPSGVTDPVGANNAAVDADTLTPLADLGVVVADTPDPVVPGGSLSYALAVSNLGPSTSPGGTLVQTLPAATTFVAATPGAPTCTHSAGVVTCSLGALDPGAGTVVTVQTSVSASATGPLSSQATVTGTAPDPVAANDSDAETTQLLLTPAEAELVHGLRLARSLAATGGVADQALYRIRQQPYSSYEVVVDEGSGDLGVGQGPLLERLASDGSTVLASSQAIGVGPARSLRLVNTTGAPLDDQLVRVRSASCGSDCGP
ncbi:MAG TPA: DUF11 domain-containing protein, partial [Vicinamibacteria bacterium]|nr:DUF11 domain-containing protein [Vicinamibacteria bacterium]